MIHTIKYVTQIDNGTTYHQAMEKEKLITRLQQPLPGRAAQEKMLSRDRVLSLEVPQHARLSAVLILLYPTENDWSILYIQRAIDGHAHSGQIGFPGGKKEKMDADLMATALREAQEEIGIDPKSIEIIGTLTSLYIPVSNFCVSPFVGILQHKPTLQLEANEVARVLEVPIKTLLDERIKTITEIATPTSPTVLRNVPAYLLERDTVLWGASAMITAELEQVLVDILSTQI